MIADATQPDLPIVYVNPAFERLTGYTVSELTGRSCNVLQGENTDPASVDQMRTAIREGQECRLTILNFRKDTSPFWCEVHLSPVRDSQGRVVQYVGVQNDVSDRVHAEIQLRRERDRANHLARHDLLTGLPNRQEFADRVEVALADLADDETAAVIFIDLDQFKQVNDQYGHSTGDDVLRESARELTELCGPDVLLARQAGDEFLAFVRSPNIAMARYQAQQLVAAASEQLIDHSAAGVMTASAGAGFSLPGRRRTLDQMLAEADQSMYEHKRSRNASMALHR